mmetsp:Transcript_114438/g.334585  ORF Transcript_114438/g.334585 Transcript_114438/m.334585 type:complete len:270 (-) Transcript_114438:239-1048(-)
MSGVHSLWLLPDRSTGPKVRVRPLLEGRKYLCSCGAELLHPNHSVTVNVQDPPQSENVHAHAGPPAVVTQALQGEPEAHISVKAQPPGEHLVAVPAAKVPQERRTRPQATPVHLAMLVITLPADDRWQLALEGLDVPWPGSEPVSRWLLTARLVGREQQLLLLVLAVHLLLEGPKVTDLVVGLEEEQVLRNDPLHIVDVAATIDFLKLSVSAVKPTLPAYAHEVLPCHFANALCIEHLEHLCRAAKGLLHPFLKTDESRPLLWCQYLKL